MAALETIERNLCENREYQVDFHNRSMKPEQLYGAKRCLLGFFRKRQLPGQVRLNKANRQLAITGDISQNDIEIILECSQKNLHPHQYSVNIMLD